MKLVIWALASPLIERDISSLTDTVYLHDHLHILWIYEIRLSLTPPLVKMTRIIRLYDNDVNV